MTTMTANDDQVCAMRQCSSLDLVFRPPEDEMTASLRYADAGGKLVEVGSGLFMDLILDRRKIHRHVTSIGEAERFDDVDDVQFRLGGLHEGQCTISDWPGLLSQVDCEHDAVIRVHVVPRSHLGPP